MLSFFICLLVLSILARYQVVLALKNELGPDLCSSVLWKSLRSFGYMFLLKKDCTEEPRQAQTFIIPIANFLMLELHV